MSIYISIRCDGIGCRYRDERQVQAHDEISIVPFLAPLHLEGWKTVGTRIYCPRCYLQLKVSDIDTSEILAAPQDIGALGRVLGTMKDAPDDPNPMVYNEDGTEQGYPDDPEEKKSSFTVGDDESNLIQNFPEKKP